MAKPQPISAPPVFRDAPGDLSRPSGNMDLSPFFRDDVADGVERHTGNSEEYLGEEREAELGRIIQSCTVTEESLAALEKAYTEVLDDKRGQSTNTVVRQKHEVRVEEARAAYMGALRER